MSLTPEQVVERVSATHNNDDPTFLGWVKVIAQVINQAGLTIKPGETR